jgi:endonuclease/exonuclease/phosphatase (EEP) superfamily protein YafD
MPTRPHPKATAFLLILTLILGILLTAITLMNLFGADRWWFGALNLYLPQIIWVVPGVLLSLAMIMVNRRWVWAPLLCVAWAFGPVMGLCWSWQTPPEPGQTSLRVMTCNTKFGTRNTPALFADIDRYHPDVVLLQDATRLIESPNGDYFRNWQVRYYAQYVIASRLPLEDAEVELINFPGQAENQSCLQCRLKIAGTVITLYNVHFLSPRGALHLLPAALKNPPFRDFAVNQLENSAASRLIQAQTLKNLLLRESGPVIVAGDFNAPEASLVLATLRDAGLHNAFTEGGRGYGYTYGHFLLPRRFPLHHSSFIRIDHIMMTPQVRAVRCWTGTAAASDHRPVFADLVLKSHSSATMR